MVFKVFPCRLLVVGPAMARPPVALTSGQCWPVLTLLSSVKYPAARYLQVPSRHHGEVRVVVGLATSQGSVQSGSTVLPASVIEAFVCLWPDSSGKYLTRNSARGHPVT
ncbi:hypothetical protein GQ44DRAFT_704075 [Phaeosphaeriaceae sp. PMI808]|nr:hypothetical protein GQ44DRAFT_704075 [Phaeosphaeriaceae sp. PMI808]